MSRRPNTGPYVVTSRDRFNEQVVRMEWQTWEGACAWMRKMLIAGKEVSVDFV